MKITDEELEVKINEVLFFSNIDNLNIGKKIKLTKPLVKRIGKREGNMFNNWSENGLDDLYINHGYNSPANGKIKYQYLYYIDTIELFDTIIKPFLDEKIREYGNTQLLEKLLHETNDIIRNLLVVEIGIPVDNISTTVDEYHNSPHKNILEFNEVIFPSNNDNNRLSYISNALRNLILLYVYDNCESDFNLAYDMIRFSEDNNHNLFVGEKSNSKLLEGKGYSSNDQYNTWKVEEYVPSIDIFELLKDYTRVNTEGLSEKQINDIVADAWQYNSSSISDSIFSKLEYYIRNNCENYFNN